MKIYFIYTSIAEALTGLGLIFIPAKVIQLLLATELNNSLDIILAMAAGVAICSIAFASWMTRNNRAPSIEIRMLLLYNSAITVVFLYSILNLAVGGVALWCITIFHAIQSVISMQLIKKTGQEKK